MKGDPLPDEDHVSRYCSPARVESGLPSAAAFELRPQDQFLSVNWLEYWGQPDLVVALDRVRKEFHLQVREDGRFAVLNVSAVKLAIERVTQRQSSVTHQPTVAMESHAGAFGFSSNDFEVAVELARMAHPQDVFPAIVDDG